MSATLRSVLTDSASSAITPGSSIGLLARTSRAMASATRRCAWARPKSPPVTL